jgi:hypothetical protein
MTPSAAEAAFRSSVRWEAESNGQKRVPLPRLRDLYLAAFPEFAQAGDLNARIAAALTAGENAGAWKLPTTAWDKAGSRTPLPRFVFVEIAGRAPDPRLGYAWTERMSFAAGLTNRVQIEAAQAINEWLKSLRGRAPVQVPIGERSLEIFGDEKRLDGLRRGNTLFGGRLTLVDIGAIEIFPPLSYECWTAAAAGAPLLIVENHASYWSFCRWNEVRLHFRAVVWGGGGGFKAAHRNLDALMLRTGAGEAFYLGDLDPAGMDIPGVTLAQRQDLGLKPFRPLAEGYDFLLGQGKERPLATPPTEKEIASAKLFLGERVRAVLDLWARRAWVPQEALGLSQIDLALG